MRIRPHFSFGSPVGSMWHTCSAARTSVARSTSPPPRTGSNAPAITGRSTRRPATCWRARPPARCPAFCCGRRGARSLPKEYRAHETDRPPHGETGAAHSGRDGPDGVDPGGAADPALAADHCTRRVYGGAHGAGAAHLWSLRLLFSAEPLDAPLPGYAG